MKKLLLSTAFLALAAGTALAADLPSRKAAPVLPPPPPPPPLWTGFYAGLNAGYGFGTNNNTQTAGVDPVLFLGHDNNAYSYTLGTGVALSGVGSQNQNGFIGGAQVGYNYQWGPSFVIGLEADIQGAGIQGSNRTAGLAATGLSYPIVAPPPVSASEQTTSSGLTSINAGVHWMGTVRGRLGYLFTPTLLAYATGGLTYGGVYANVNQSAASYTQHFHAGVFNHDWNHSFSGGGSKSQTLVGWNVGGGLEWLFMPNWSLKAEAIYWNMGNMNVPTAAYAAAPVPSLTGDPEGVPSYVIGGTRVNYQGVIARAGVNYHFNWGASAPIVAKY